jgi:hypothetical protein
MRVSDLTRPKPRNADIDLGDGDTVHVVFDSNKVTPNWVAEAKTRDEAEDVLSLPKCIAEVMISWDVTADDGSAYPPTAENIAVLSHPALSKLLLKILSSAMPSDAEGKASSEPPSTLSATSTDPAPTFQNGQPTSPSPVPSASQ